MSMIIFILAFSATSTGFGSPLGHRDSFTPQALLYRLLRSQKRRNKGSGPRTTLCRAIVPSALVGLRDVRILLESAGGDSAVDCRLTVGNLKHIINGRMRQILWASGVRVKRSTLHFRSVLPMVEFMVEAKTPPTFRFLSAQCVCPCANSNLSGTRFRSYCILC
jgi:hypothetical protein